MGYPTSNAAYAYDMQPDAYEAHASANPARHTQAQAAKPSFGVVIGAGREASQATSPMFTHCVKVFCVLAATFVVLGAARVAIAGVTASSLNAAAELSGQLETAQEASADLEVMRSVYGASTRIRDLAEGYGMVAAEGNVVLDFTEYAPAEDGAAANAQQ